ncbi:IS66 family insertion sequence element accessory protein TnpA [Desulfosporosinus youngiae]|jgi:hypothetical protein|uniref:Transposase n=1 Tax=Desulfosporosinus youngiae DSM 17734 TaxID=768710 RepID=H5XVP5_9FIRM|nr:hypothetical protein [Desulfosporosinus youngiae]EHQ90128.1 hypothetical protein DesyoDRAFT_3091 [Desulfosporosinus youngiae DSM 17734]
MSRETSLELWRDRVAAYRSSGLTAKQWCAENSFPISTLHYWMRKIKNSVSCENTVPEFVSLSEALPDAECSPLVVKIGLFSVMIPENFRPEQLARVIGLLKNHA